ncbi:MAG: TlpA family protein disulfide reductase [Fimbriimonadaceae bacterium]
MKAHHRLALLVAILGARSAIADNLTIGSPAPPLSVAKWYKGAPVMGFASGKTYVVEFWATWCAPCRDSIPHLTELAHQNKDITFIGVSIWEDDDGHNIAKFIHDMGDKMDYHVGYSSNKAGMAASWMDAAGQNAIPTAFVVKDSIIQWIGHPMELAQPLAQIKAGTFDAAAFRARFAKKQQDAIEQAKLQSQVQACVQLYSGGKRAEATENLTALAAKYASIAPEADDILLDWLAADDLTAWEAKASAMAHSPDTATVEALGVFAVRQAEGNGGNRKLGMKAISLAVAGSHGKDVLVLYYATVIYTTSKQYRLALDAANAFLKEIPNSRDYKDNKDLINFMQAQQKDLVAKLKKTP